MDKLYQQLLNDELRATLCILKECPDLTPQELGTILGQLARNSYMVGEVAGLTLGLQRGRWNAAQTFSNN